MISFAAFMFLGAVACFLSLPFLRNYGEQVIPQILGWGCVALSFACFMFASEIFAAKVFDPQERWLNRIVGIVASLSAVCICRGFQLNVLEKLFPSKT
jgi:hypothetical protein